MNTNRLRRPGFNGIWFAALAGVAILGSCSNIETQDAALRAAVEKVQADVAPDRRVAVFDVTWERSSVGLVAKGEVDREDAKSRVLEVMRQTSGTEILDSIRLLPEPVLAERPFGVVTVSVGNMRSRPRHSAEMVSQVLMGMVVKLMKRHGGWYYVQSADQYLGWIEGESLHLLSEEDLDQWRTSARLVTITPFGWVRQSPASSAKPVSDIVVGCLFKTTGKARSWWHVELPDGRTGYVESSAVQDFARWKEKRRLTAENVEASAETFLGVPYLWGGTSAKAFDCSGFTKTVFRMNGLELNRDANQQATQGDDIPQSNDWTNLRKGDLLFFGRAATDSETERISHVGIYLGAGAYIHCSGYVRINSFDPAAPNYDPFNDRRYVRARRVIGTHSIPEVF